MEDELLQNRILCAQESLRALDPGVSECEGLVAQLDSRLAALENKCGAPALCTEFDAQFRASAGSSGLGIDPETHFHTGGEAGSDFPRSRSLIVTSSGAPATVISDELSTLGSERNLKDNNENFSEDCAAFSSNSEHKSATQVYDSKADAMAGQPSEECHQAMTEQTSVCTEPDVPGSSDADIGSQEDQPCITMDGVDSATLEVCLRFLMHISKGNARNMHPAGLERQLDMADRHPGAEVSTTGQPELEEKWADLQLPQHALDHTQLLDLLILADYLQVEPLLHATVNSLVASMFPPRPKKCDTTSSDAPTAGDSTPSVDRGYTNIFGVREGDTADEEDGEDEEDEEEAAVTADDVRVLSALPDEVSLLLVSHFPLVDGWEVLKAAVEEEWWSWRQLQGRAEWVAAMLRWGGEREQRREEARRRGRERAKKREEQAGALEWWKVGPKPAANAEEEEGEESRPLVDPFVPALLERALAAGDAGEAVLGEAVRVGVGARALFAVSVMWARGFGEEEHGGQQRHGDGEARSGGGECGGVGGSRASEVVGGGAKAAWSSGAEGAEDTGEGGRSGAGGGAARAKSEEEAGERGGEGTRAGWGGGVLGAQWAEEYRKRMEAELESESQGVISLSEGRAANALFSLEKVTPWSCPPQPCLPSALEDVAFIGREQCELLPAHLPILFALFRFIHRLPSLRDHIIRGLHCPPPAHVPCPPRRFSTKPSVVSWMLPPSGAQRCRDPAEVLALEARWQLDHADGDAKASGTGEELSAIPEEVLLSVLGVFGCEEAEALVAEGVVQCEELPRRRALDLEGCASVLTATVVRGCHCFPTLRRIDLKGAVLVTDEVLRGIARSCPLLEMLQVGGCSRLSNEGLVRFIASLSTVEAAGMDGQRTAALLKLSLMNCSQLTNSTLSAVAEKLPGLRDLCIYGCYRMTDDALIRFKRSHRLSKLNTSGCYKITDMGIRYLMQVKPTLLLYHKHRDFYLPLTERDLR